MASIAKSFENAHKQRLKMRHVCYTRLEARDESQRLCAEEIVERRKVDDETSQISNL